MNKIILNIIPTDELLRVKSRIMLELLQMIIKIKDSENKYDKRLTECKYVELISIKDDINEELKNRGVEI